MQLKELATKPTLKKVTLDNEAIVELYGEPLEFYMMDRQDLPTYLKLAQVQGNQEQIFDMVKSMILDEKGNQVLGAGEMLPLEVTVPVLEAAIQQLGNTKPQTSQV